MLVEHGISTLLPCLRIACRMEAAEHDSLVAVKVIEREGAK
jgi:hypothetical protein